MGFNPYGTIRVIDCNITIEDTSDIEAQESMEADHIEIGGNTIISSDAKNYSLFYFRNDTGNPYIKFLLLYISVSLFSEITVLAPLHFSLFSKNLVLNHEE